MHCGIFVVVSTNTRPSPTFDPRWFSIFSKLSCNFLLFFHYSDTLTNILISLSSKKNIRWILPLKVQHFAVKLTQQIQYWRIPTSERWLLLDFYKITLVSIANSELDVRPTTRTRFIEMLADVISPCDPYRSFANVDVFPSASQTWTAIRLFKHSITWKSWILR